MEGYCSFRALMEKRKLSMNPKSQWHIFCQAPILEGLLLSNCEFFHSYKKNPWNIQENTPLPMLIFCCISFTWNKSNMFSIAMKISISLRKNRLSAKSADKILMKMTVGKKIFPHPRPLSLMASIRGELFLDIFVRAKLEGCVTKDCSHCWCFVSLLSG